MDSEDGVYDFMPAATADVKNDSVLAELSEDYQPASEAANERLGKAAEEAMKIIASDN